MVSNLIFLSKGGICYSDILNYITIQECISFLKRFSELYEEEIKIMSPAHLLGLMYGR